MSSPIVSTSYQGNHKALLSSSYNKKELSEEQKNLLFQEFQKLIETFKENQEKRFICNFFLGDYGQEPKIELKVETSISSWYLWEDNSFLEKETFTIPFQITDQYREATTSPENLSGTKSMTYYCKNSPCTPTKNITCRFRMELSGPKWIKQPKSHMHPFYNQLLFIMQELRKITQDHCNEEMA